MENITKILYQIEDYLSGKKTYIVSVVIGIYTVLKAFNIIETTIEQDFAVYGLLASLFGVSVRAAINKK